MIQNSPLIRRVLYLATVATAGVAIVFGYVPTHWAGWVADAARELAVYLGGLTGWTASSNLTGLGVDTRKPTP